MKSLAINLTRTLRHYRDFRSVHRVLKNIIVNINKAARLTFRFIYSNRHQSRWVKLFCLLVDMVPWFKKANITDLEVNKLIING